MAKYNKQIKAALEAVKQSNSKLEGLIKRGDTQGALTFMREGLLHEQMQYLEDLINIQERDENPKIGHLS